MSEWIKRAFSTPLHKNVLAYVVIESAPNIISSIENGLDAFSPSDFKKAVDGYLVDDGVVAGHWCGYIVPVPGDSATHEINDGVSGTRLDEVVTRAIFGSVIDLAEGMGIRLRS